MKKIVLTNYPLNRIITGLLTGAVVQLVRAPACHAGSCEFDSRQSRHNSGRTEHMFNDRFLFMGDFIFILDKSGISIYIIY